jgi:5-methylcytosine-specific restriction protein A
MKTRNPKWTREELILALDLYFQLKPAQFLASNNKIIDLNVILKKLNAYPEHSSLKTFRNPNGVAKKLSNFLRLDPSYQGRGLEHGSMLEEEIWKKFRNDKSSLNNKVKNILKRIIVSYDLPPETCANNKLVFSQCQALAT